MVELSRHKKNPNSALGPAARKPDAMFVEMQNHPLVERTPDRARQPRLLEVENTEKRL
jgi:hypothetical protein